MPAALVRNQARLVSRNTISHRKTSALIECDLSDYPALTLIEFTTRVLARSRARKQRMPGFSANNEALLLQPVSLHVTSATSVTTTTTHAQTHTHTHTHTPHSSVSARDYYYQLVSYTYYVFTHSRLHAQLLLQQQQRRAVSR